jgi:hypothetical protein
MSDLYKRVYTKSTPQNKRLEDFTFNERGQVLPWEQEEYEEWRKANEEPNIVLQTDLETGLSYFLEWTRDGYEVKEDLTEEERGIIKSYNEKFTNSTK